MTSVENKPVYVLYGTDAFLRDAHRQEIIAGLIGDADPQTCVANYDADAELAAVLDDLRTLPFLASQRVVIVRDADAFITAYRPQIETYVETPVETASLILIVSSWPKNTRLFKLVDRVGAAVDCAPAEKGNVRGWLTDAADRRGKKLANDAAELLGEWVGLDRASLDGEIEKLSLYVGDRDTITLADVSALVTSTAGPAPFALSDALTAMDMRAALTALGQMLTVRGDEFKSLGMIAWHLRRIVKVHQLIAGGKSLDAAKKSVRVFHPQLGRLLKQRPMAKLTGDFRKLLQADRAMKTGANPTTALQQLVVSLCS